MAYRREFSSAVTRNFHYRFTCEHCKKTTDWIKGTVYGTAYYDMSASTTSLTTQQSSDLHKLAIEKLNKGYEKVKKLAETGSYSDMTNVAIESTDAGSAYRDHSKRNVGFPAKCPYCGKGQSWQTGEYYYFIAVPMIVLPFVFAGLWVLFSGLLESYPFGEAFGSVPFSVWLFGLGVGLLVGIVLYIFAKRKVTNGKIRNKPEFRWE